MEREDCYFPIPKSRFKSVLIRSVPWDVQQLLAFVVTEKETELEMHPFTFNQVTFRKRPDLQASKRRFYEPTVETPERV
jgi:hypothetical protein